MNTILRLFYDLTVYKDIQSQPLRKSLARFFLTYLLLACGYSLYVSHTILPQLTADVFSVTDKIIATLPHQAVFSFDGTTLSTQNLPTPLILDPYFHLDPTANASALASSSAYVTLGATHLRLKGEADVYDITSYADLDLDPFTLTGENLITQLTQSRANLNQLLPYLPLILALPLYPALTVLRFFNVIFYSLFFLLGFAVTKSSYRFTHILKLTLNSIIVAETLNLAILAIYHTNHPTIFSLAFIGVSILAYMNLPVRIQLKN
jgi:hypothetical protein